MLPTIQALAGEDVDVIVTTGEIQLELDVVPENVQIVDFVPYTELLPHVDVMVTNGGFNGVQTALAYGVPIVAAGRTEEKPEVCARVAWSGWASTANVSGPNQRRLNVPYSRYCSTPNIVNGHRYFRPRLLSRMRWVDQSNCWRSLLGVKLL
ncbi:MAG: hypothetical protein HC805_04100 [Alkalinema sp. RL_2_19]|nr:hypothetical protein [Alkalinema sp. RL_2_19]